MVDKNAEESPTSDSQTDANASVDSSATVSDDAKPEESGTDTGQESGQEGDESLLDVVQKAVSEKDQETDSQEDSSSSESESERSDESEGSDSSQDSDADEDDDIPQEFHKHPAWQRIKKQRDEYKEQAQKHEQVQQFMQQNDVSAEDAASALELVAKIKQDPRTAAQELEKITNGLKQQVGDILPEDLQQEVSEGAITPERAQELARSRADAQRYQQQSETERQRQEQLRKQQTQQQLSSVADQWEESWKANDPDYDHKKGLVRDKVQVLVAQNGAPQSQQQVEQYLNEAKRLVEDDLKPFRPAKKERKPVQSDSKAPSSGNQGEPKSLLEANQQAVGMA